MSEKRCIFADEFMIAFLRRKEYTMLKKEFEYYLDNQDELVKLYNGKYVVIKDDSVVGAYDTESEAYYGSVEKYPLGSFMIQKCTPGDKAYTQRFFNNNVIFA